MSLTCDQMRQIAEAVERAPNFTTVQLYTEGLLVTAERLKRTGPPLRSSRIVTWKDMDLGADNPVAVVQLGIDHANRSLGNDL